MTNVTTIRPATWRLALFLTLFATAPLSLEGCAEGHCYEPNNPDGGAPAATIVCIPRCSWSVDGVCQDAEPLAPICGFNDATLSTQCEVRCDVELEPDGSCREPVAHCPWSDH